MEYRGYKLDAFQAESIQALAEGRSVLVSAPTGTGKTLIADFVVENALKKGRSVIYTAPVKALSNQKYRDWCRLHGEQNVGLMTGDLVIRRDAPCRVMTTEILRNMLLTGDELPDLEAVIIDEIHFLDDPERGTVWEEVLIYLPQRVQILGLSATLDNLEEFRDWLSFVRESEVALVRATHRTVPLSWHVFGEREGLQSPKEFHKVWTQKGGMPKQDREEERGRDGGRDGGRGGGRDGGRGGRSRKPSGPVTSHVSLIAKLGDDFLLPCLYFAFSRKNTERYARELGRAQDASFLNGNEIRQSSKILDAFSKEDTGKVLDPDLRDLYLTGIAFHHAGLHVQLKALVEDLYEQRLLKVLYCTSTFALGINMPARTVVFDALAKFDGIRTRPLRNREFQQKAGRAGRRGMDTEGHVVVRADAAQWPELREMMEVYQKGAPEPVHSSFSLSFHSIVNLLERYPYDKIRTLVDRSFLSWTRARRAADMEERALEQQQSPEKGAQKLAHKELAKAVGIRAKSWEEFEARVGFLQKFGYLAVDRSFNAGATALKYIQIEDIFVTELFLGGHLDDLSPEILFGVCCALNRDFPRDVYIRYKMFGPEAAIASVATRIRISPIVREAEAMTKQEVTWCPEMIPFGRMWAEGKPFAELMTFIEASTDLTGDLITAFRRAKDLISQLRDIWRGDKERGDALTALMQKVSRDEVMVVD